MELFIEGDPSIEEMSLFIEENYGKIEISKYEKIPVEDPKPLQPGKYEFVVRDIPTFDYKMPTQESLDEFNKNDYMSQLQKPSEKKEDKMEIDT